MKKIIMTGPTGAIGYALIRKCIKEQTEVHAICRPGSARLCTIPRSPLVHVTECGLDRIRELGGSLPRGCDVFYHFAWMGTTGGGRDDMYLQNRNVQYSLDAVELCREIECRAFVGAGSQAEYGRAKKPLAPDTPAFPETGYGMAKLCAGQMTRQVCLRYGIRHVWPRIFSVYGPNDSERSLIMSVLSKLSEGQRIALTKAEQMWDYLYSADAAEALYRMGERGRDGSVYCLGSGKVRPLRSYIQQLGGAAAAAGLQEGPEALLGYGELPYGEKQIMYLCADPASLRRETGFEAETAFADGIRETVEWYIKHKEVEE